MADGKVFLVGAGPGHPKLITVKGLEALQRSDCIVYDRLAGPHLLGRARADAQLYYVGKLPDRHSMKQEDINQLLVDLAKQGKTVTRLKGGDPTVFGRVGEEAELLKQHGITYEIIPGITSAIAVPAYAGIPITHRDLASSFSVITGHESPDKLDHAIQWDKVAHAMGTLIFLMGVSKIDYIAEQLMRYGKSPQTPVALVRWGTRAEQRTLVGTLENIAHKVSQSNFQPPAVIVVGEVVRQRERLAWIESRPLFGARILVTRARSQASELADQIEALGGEPFEYPVIETRLADAADNAEAIRMALQQAEDYDWVVLTSVNAVHYFYTWLDRCKVDVRRFHRARFAAVGPKTAQALAASGIVADVQPDTYTAEGLLESLTAEGGIQQGQHVLLPRGNLARDVLTTGMRQLGVKATAVDIYETIHAHHRSPYLLDMLEQGEIHLITFTSSSTVHGLLDALRSLGADDPVALMRKTDIACIGPITARTAEQYGLHVAVTAEHATIESLLDAIVAFRQTTQEERG